MTGLLHRAIRRAERIRWPRIEVRDVVMIALVAVCLLFTATSVNRANPTWCQTLDRLTSRPVHRPADPAANPSREQAYHLYSVFAEQRHRLGCG